MRLTAPVFVLVVAGCAVWARASFTVPEPVYDHPHGPESRIGLAAALEQTLGGAALDLSTSKTTGDLIFRARLPVTTRHLADPISSPVHGRARPICLTGLDQARCWRIMRLSVDGRAKHIE